MVVSVPVQEDEVIVNVSPANTQVSWDPEDVDEDENQTKRRRLEADIDANWELARPKEIPEMSEGELDEFMELLTAVTPPDKAVRAGRPGGSSDFEPDDENSLDAWHYDPRKGRLTRIHNELRRRLYVPGDAGRPVYLSSLRSSRRTYLKNERGVRVVIDDHWRAAGKIEIGYGWWTGRTIFTVKGHRTVGEEDRFEYRPTDDEEDLGEPSEEESPRRSSPRTKMTRSRSKGGAGTSANSAGHGRSAGSTEEIYKAPTEGAYEAAENYVKYVEEEFGNTPQRWIELVNKGNYL